jgi:hypothetical protein
LAGVAVFLLAACGGGSSGNLAGIEGTGLVVASGPITGFGSIFVNGIEFSTTGATILFNGQTGTESQLRVGQIVNVTGSVNAGGTAGTATQVLFNANVQGPLAAVDTVNSTLTALGQTVTVGPNTSFSSDSGATPRLDTLSAGALIEVSGFASSNGGIAATRIDVKTQVDAFRITGIVRSLDTVNHSFKINAATVNFSAAAFGGFPSGRSVQNGDMVAVSSAPAPSSGSGPIAATRVDYLAGVMAGTGVAGEIEGVITRFASAADFDVSGVHVTANSSTTYEGGTAADLAQGSNVEVHGQFDASGTLVAGHIEINGQAPLLVKSVVEAVNATANSLTVLGVPITTSAGTRFDDQSANPLTPFWLADVRVGDYVEVHGRPATGNGIAATLLTREVQSGAVELRGSVTSATGPTVVILGIGAVTDAATQYRDSSGQTLTSAQFFARAVGATVDLQGTLSGGSLAVATAKLVGEAELDD